ncbi:MAG: serine/threonine protein kinase [Bryobacterales bacterium]|nr:serine/threonine protein kinase [Bryobacterales bacterium]
MSGESAQSRIRELFDQAIDCPTESEQDALLASWSATGDGPHVSGLRRLLEADRELARTGGSAGARRLPEPPPQLPVFGPYRAVRVLGRGGMGTVYLAERADGQFEHQVAVKAVATPILDTAGRAQFLQERQILAGLHHPGIATLIDGGVLPDGTPYLVMELVEGLHLDVYCNRQQLSVRRRIALVREVCEAVSLAHRQLIVHRDLKPSNILVTAEGNPKLVDFGTARFLTDAQTAGPAMLTPRYASPEQLRREPVSTAADTFALGVIVAELLTGRWPFGNPDSPVDSLRRVSEGVEAAPLDKQVSPEHAALCGTPLAALRAELSGDLNAVVARCLETDPARRYRSVDELSEDLRRYLAREPVLARPQTRRYRMLKFLGRHRLEATVAMAALVLLTALGLVSAQQYARRQRRSGQLRDLNRVLLNEVYQEVGRLPGSAKARAMIAGRTRQALDELLAEEPADESVREALASAYIQLAEVQGEPFSLSLGDTAAAMSSYRQAEQTAARHGALWVRARTGLAGLQIRAGDYLDAARTVRLTLPAAEALGRDPMLSFRLHKMLAHALLREGDRRHDAALLREALSQSERTVAIAERMREADSTLPDLAAKHSQYVGFVNELLARCAGEWDRYRLAVQAHQRAADGAVRDFARSGSAQDRRDLADTLSFLGAARVLARDDAGAVAALSAAVDHFNVLAAADASAQELNLDLALAHFFWGEAEIGLHRLPAAALHLRQAEKRAGLPATPTKVDREKVELYVRVQQQRARLHRANGDYAAALRSLAEAQRVGEQWQKLAPWEMERLRRKRVELESGSKRAIPEDDWLH